MHSSIATLPLCLLLKLFHCTENVLRYLIHYITKISIFDLMTD